jgi:hypothetical protein
MTKLINKGEKEACVKLGCLMNEIKSIRMSIKLFDQHVGDVSKRQP